MTCSESAAVQRPGSSDVEQMSEKDQREAAPVIDAFDLTVVRYYIFHTELVSSCYLSFGFV